MFGYEILNSNAKVQYSELSKYLLHTVIDVIFKSRAVSTPQSMST